MRLLETAFKKGRQSKVEVDDAIQFIKLLYLAAQEGYYKERLELLLRSSRLEAMTALSEDREIKNR